MFQCPSTKESDIPHRTSVANTIHKKAYKVRGLLRSLFVVGPSHYFLTLTLTSGHQSIPGEISATLDGWSSLACDLYLGVTVHWVHNTPDSCTEWSLCTLLLTFQEVKGNHSGANLARLVMQILQEVGLTSKVCVASISYKYLSH
jgi:hypothetical protein